MDSGDRLEENAAKRPDSLYFKAFQESPNGIALLSADGHFHEVNPTLCRILGYSEEELTRLSFNELTHPDDLESNLIDVARLKRREIHSMEVEKRYRHKQGHWVPTFLRTSLVFGADGVPEMYVSHIRDLTALKEAERESRERDDRLKQAERLEGLGLLAGGVAHDFNNLLASIIGNADLVLSQVPQSDPIRESIQAVILAGHRAADLCNQLMAYAGRSRIMAQPIRFPQLLTEILNILKVTHPKSVQVVVACDETVPPFDGDVIQIRQVVMNLMTNAIEAVTATGRDGTVSVKFGSSESAPDPPVLSTTELTGSYVFFQITDTGVGMSEETQSKIFDPFFTTKFTGRGLGLAAVRGIVLSHRGSLQVLSEVDRGTTVTVFLPATLEGTGILDTGTKATSDWTRGEGLILLVDDDEFVLDVAEKILRRAGFDVICAPNGTLALARYRERHEELVAVVLDITMPDLNGFESYALMREVSDRVPVLFSSGYANDDVAGELSPLGTGAFIQKPYRAADFLIRLAEIIKS